MRCTRNGSKATKKRIGLWGFSLLSIGLQAIGLQVIGLKVIGVQAAWAAPEYRRSDWPHWIDSNHNCLNTRHELLKERSEHRVTFKPRSRCQIIRGQWTDPYSGKQWFKASDVDIDHLIPLKWAHQHGGHLWNTRLRETFANDPLNLLIVEDGLNQNKSASGPDEWLPPKNRCWYKQKWQHLIELYSLDGAHLNLTCSYADKVTDIGQNTGFEPYNPKSPGSNETNTNSASIDGAVVFECHTDKRYCRQMNTCEEALFYLNQCGVTTLDGDRDGLPCEALCQ